MNKEMAKYFERKDDVPLLGKGYGIRKGCSK